MSPVIVALDYSTASAAVEVAQRLSPELCRLKVGKGLFTSSGPALVDQLQRLGFDVFLDLKFHDIPNTVANAVSAAVRLDVQMLTIHTSGGTEMMAAAEEAAPADDVLELTEVADELNNRPRKTLTMNTPAELMANRLSPHNPTTLRVERVATTT